MLCLALGAQVRGRVDGRPVTTTSTMPFDSAQTVQTPEVAAALLTLLRSLFSSAVNPGWAAAFARVGKSALNVLPQALQYIANSTPAAAVRLPQLWVSLAALSVAESVNATLDLPVIGAGDELKVDAGVIVTCENHADGTTLAKWGCDACGTSPLASWLRASSGSAVVGALSLCDECDQCLHLASTLKTHSRAALRSASAEVMPYCSLGCLCIVCLSYVMWLDAPAEIGCQGNGRWRDCAPAMAATDCRPWPGQGHCGVQGDRHHARWRANGDMSLL